MQIQLLRKATRFPIISLYLFQNILSGWLVEPIYWLQKIFFKKPTDMPNPIFIVGAWRSGTTLLHTELVKATRAATIRNTFSCCPQSALIFKKLICRFLPSFKTRFFDWVPLLADGPQELDIALMRFSCDHPPTSIGLGKSLSKDLAKWYRWKVTSDFKKSLKLILEWAWIHDGLSGKIFINKAPAFTTRVDVLLELWPEAKFIYIKREFGHKESIERSIKSFNKEFGFISYIGDASKDAQATRSFIFDKWKIMKNLIPKDNLIEITYEDLVNNTKKTIDNLKIFTSESTI